MPAIQLLLAKSTPVITFADIVSTSGGNICVSLNWSVFPRWLTLNADDTLYQIDITGIAGVAGSTTGKSTVNGSSWQDNTGFQGNTQNGPFTEQATAQYTIKLVRKSDSVVIQQMNTDVATLDYSLEACS